MYYILYYIDYIYYVIIYYIYIILYTYYIYIYIIYIYVYICLVRWKSVWLGKTQYLPISFARRALQGRKIYS